MRRWLYVASAPGTGDSQALAPAPCARSLAPPPPSPRRPNPPARAYPKGREPACLAPRDRGRRGGGEGRLGTRRTPHAAAQEAWGADTHSHSSPGLPGGRQRQREPVRAGVTGAREKLKPAHFQAPSSLPSSQSRVMSLTPRGRPRMCLSSSYDSRDQLCMVAPSTLAKITKSLSVP